MEDLVSQLKALGERNRLDLCVQLATARCSGVDLLARVPGLSQPSLSRHLRVLRDAGIIHEDKQGRRVVYRLASKELTEVVIRLFREGEGAAYRKNMSQDTSIVLSPTDIAESDDFQEWLR